MKEIAGMHENPKTQAACQVNIKKAFQTLKQKPGVPLSILYNQEKVLEGDREYIVNLLRTLKQVYRSKRVR